MPPKTKQNYSAENMPEKDRCGTPPYALEPLLPFMDRDTIIWESASGEGLLVNALRRKGYDRIIYSDILQHPSEDFFKTDCLQYTEVAFGAVGKLIITNPPYSLKYKWLARCYELGYPFALLMPSDTLFAASANKLFQKHGIEIIIMNPRVDFKMPNTGWSGKGAQMATAWFTWKLNIGQMITFADISVAKKAFKDSFVEGIHAAPEHL